jgi:hypothetical protein
METLSTFIRETRAALRACRNIALIMMACVHRALLFSAAL